MVSCFLKSNATSHSWWVDIGYKAANKEQKCPLDIRHFMTSVSLEIINAIHHLIYPSTCFIL